MQIENFFSYTNVCFFFCLIFHPLDFFFLLKYFTMGSFINGEKLTIFCRLKGTLSQLKVQRGEILSI
jgi:hypothetical protein